MDDTTKKIEIKATMVLPDLPYIPTLAIPSAVIKLASFQSELAARMALNGMAQSVKEPEASKVPDTQLTPEEAAKLAGVTKAWIYGHWKRLGIGARLSHKVLRISRSRLERWLASRGRI